MARINAHIAHPRMRHAGRLLGLCVALLVAATAVAQDLSPALQGLGYIQGAMAREAARKAEAERQREIRESPLNARESLGALALDGEGTAYGIYIEPPGKGDRTQQFVQSTARKAVEACESQNPRTPCNFVTSFNFECISIAWSGNTLRPFWHNAFMLKAAEQFAMEKCEKGGGNCRRVDTQCAIRQGDGIGLFATGSKISGTIPNAAEQGRIQARPPMLGMFIIDPKATVLLGLLNQPYPRRGKKVEQLSGEIKVLTLINGNRQDAAAVMGNTAIEKTPVHVFVNTCSAVALPSSGDRSAKALIFADAPSPALASELAKARCEREYSARCDVTALDEAQSCTGDFIRAPEIETARGPVFGAVAVDPGLLGVAITLNQNSRAQAKAAVEASTTLVAPLNGRTLAEANPGARASSKVGTVMFANACVGIAHPTAGARSLNDVFFVTAEAAADARSGAKGKCESVTGAACVAIRRPQTAVCSGDYTKDLAENWGDKSARGER